MVKLFSWTFPSVCVLCVANVLFRDSISSLRIVGNRVPSLAQQGMRNVHAVFNLAVAVAGYIVIHGACRPAVDVLHERAHADGLHQGGLARAVRPLRSAWPTALWTSSYPAHTSSFHAHGRSGIVIAWRLIGDKGGLGPLFVALLLARRSRFALPRMAKYRCIVLRFAVGTIAFNAREELQHRVSKASVGILLSTVLLSSATPCSTPPNGSATPALVPKAPAPRPEKQQGHRVLGGSG